MCPNRPSPRASRSSSCRICIAPRPIFRSKGMRRAVRRLIGTQATVDLRQWVDVFRLSSHRRCQAPTRGRRRRLVAAPIPSLSAERNINAGNIASRRPDRDRLPVAPGDQEQVGREGCGLGGYEYLTAAGAAGNGPGDVTGRLGPGTGNRTTLVTNVAEQVEIVAVARA